MHRLEFNCANVAMAWTINAAAIASLLISLAAAAQPIENTQTGPCADALSDGFISVESGETPMRVEGAVYRSDGVTPAAGVIVYAYQTGVDGSYDINADGVPKRRAFMRTNEQGAFTLNTLRPGSYPSGSEPAHIHFQFWGTDAPLQWSPAMVLSDDPLVSDAMRRDAEANAPFNTVVSPEFEDGVWRVRVAYRLKPRADSFQRSILHGAAACGHN